jgi:putative tryptophan/tyrosine transport system substrate-binding protein
LRHRDLLFGSRGCSRRLAYRCAGGARERTHRVHLTGEAFPRRYFDEAMRLLGWIEGRNLITERRVTGEDPERRSVAATGLVAAAPEVIVAAGQIDARAVRAVTGTIPIVMVAATDPVEPDLAASLAHPGGNVTGMTILRGELDGKRFEPLHDLMPSATRSSMLAIAR